MKSASLKQLKDEFKNLSREEAVALCTRLAKFKKENKELLTYLLFEERDEAGYIQAVKEEIEEEFENINTSTAYVSKKGVQRVMRILKKKIRYSGKKETEVEILLFFCKTLKGSRIRISSSRIIANIYDRQIITIQKALSTMHEDLRFDYEEDLNELIGR
jgi:hypothetical protein